MDGEIRLINKALVDYTSRLPEVTLDAERIPAGDYVIDGELCVFGPDGRTVFKGSQIRCSTEDLAKQRLLRAKYPVVFMAFDIQQLDGRDTEDLPYELRKKLLHDLLLSQNQAIRYTPHFDEDKRGIFGRLIAAGEEGAIMKRHGSRYENRRSNSWLKVKKWDQERCLVVGYTPGEGKRAGRFGALILAKKGDDGRLLYVGKVGSGFNDQEITRIYDVLRRSHIDGAAFASRVNEPYQPVDVPLEVTVKYFEVTEQGVFRMPSLMKEFGRNMIHYDRTIVAKAPKQMSMKEMLDSVRTVGEDASVSQKWRGNGS